MQKDKKFITIEFKLYFTQTDESGVEGTLYFQDENGTILRIKNTPNADFSQGILVTMNEPKYRAVRGKTIGPHRLKSIVSIATNSEINLADVKETKLNIEPIKEGDENDSELTILFKMLYFKPSYDRNLRKELIIVKYIDPLGNSVYLTQNEYESLFGGKYFCKYLALTFSLEDIEKDFQRTKLRYPDAVRVNLSIDSIRFAKKLHSKKYDYSILDEIQEGQRAGDARYNTKNVLNLYQEILELREEERRKRENEIDFNEPFERLNERSKNKL